MPKPGRASGIVYFFLRSARKRAFSDASAFGIPKQYIDKQDPWPTVCGNLSFHRDPKDVKVIVLDPLTTDPSKMVSGPYTYDHICKELGVSPNPRRRKKRRR